MFTINPNVYQLKTILENIEVSEKVRNGLNLKYPGAKETDLVGMVSDIINIHIQVEKDNQFGLSH